MKFTEADNSLTPYRRMSKLQHPEWLAERRVAAELASILGRLAQREVTILFRYASTLDNRPHDDGSHELRELNELGYATNKIGAALQALQPLATAPAGNDPKPEDKDDGNDATPGDDTGRLPVG